MPQVLEDEVRAHILDGALEVFARDGFSSATMASIAKAAGVVTTPSRIGSAPRGVNRGADQALPGLPGP
jgi:hypothetical protein